MVGACDVVWKKDHCVMMGHGRGMWEEELCVVGAWSGLLDDFVRIHIYPVLNVGCMEYGVCLSDRKCKCILVNP